MVVSPLKKFTRVRSRAYWPGAGTRAAWTIRTTASRTSEHHKVITYQNIEFRVRPLLSVCSVKALSHDPTLAEHMKLKRDSDPPLLYRHRCRL